MKLSAWRKLNAVGCTGPAQKQRGILKHDGQIGHDQLPHFATAGNGSAPAECALGAVVADENNGAVKKRAGQIASVQKQFAFENFSARSLLGPMCIKKTPLAMGRKSPAPAQRKTRRIASPRLHAFKIIRRSE